EERTHIWKIQTGKRGRVEIAWTLSAIPCSPTPASLCNRGVRPCARDGRRLDKNIKVLALSKYDRQGASSRHRILASIPLVQERGLAITSLPLLSNTYVERRTSGLPLNFIDVARSLTRRLVALCYSHRFDVLWIEGELFPRSPAFVEQLLSVMGMPYVLDLDDAIFHTYVQHPNFLIRNLLGYKIDVVLRNAAVVTAGNDYLAERAGRAGARHVFVIPTTVDDRAYAKTQHVPGGKLRFGWIGS